jgi:DNA-binding winged helix-turn-helix (wHTH) protein/predicted Zn-dependent protease
MHPIRFGTFELHGATQELFKQGVRLRLSPQAFQVLRLLLEKPGQLITREEFHKALWPADTFVDFDHGLNNAVKRIRDVLNDSADDPLYIETLPRLGYRFIGRIGQNGNDMAAPAAVEFPLMSVPVAEKSETKAGQPVLLTVAMILAAAIVLFGLSGSAWWLFSRKAPTLTEKDSIVLADFANATGDPVFDGTLRQGLLVQLEQSPLLSIVSGEQIQETLERMGQKPNAKLTAEIAREVCQRTSSVAVLDGLIAQIGSRYQLTLRAINCADGKSIASAEVLANDKNRVLDALGIASLDIRKKLGESLSSIQKYDAPLPQVTTPSLDALRAFSLSATLPKQGVDSGLPFLKRAVELDPHFAVAYVQLSDAYDAVGENELASEYAQKAFDNREQASQRERLQIDATYYSATLGDTDRELSVYAVWQQMYPRDPGPWVDSSDTRNSLGDYEHALQEAGQAIRLAPNSYVPYMNAGRALLCLNRWEEADELARRALARGIDATALHLLLYQIAFLENNEKEMRAQLAPVLATPDSGGALALFAQSGTEAYLGRLRGSLEFSSEGVKIARSARFNDLAAQARIADSLREAEFGDSGRARQAAATALTISSGRTAKLLVALALARSGDVPRAQALADELEKRFPSDTRMKNYWLPTIRASIELDRGNPAKALAVLRDVSYELSDARYLVGNLYPVYVRGEAYLGTHQGREAAAEFQKFLDHKGIALNSVLGSLARLGLARAYLLQDDKMKAREAYQDFLALWKGADPDIPILKQAKAEYANVQ